MKEKELTPIFEEEIEAYINNIAKELEKAHDKWFDNFGFPMFGATSKDYHEQVYFQSYLESYTRKMINGILKEITYFESVDKIVWPEFEYAGIYNGYTNVECEKKFGFEFINKDRKIGYKYSSIDVDTIEKLFAQEDIDSIKLVEWQFEEKSIKIDYNDNRVKVINVWELFQDLFYETSEEEIKIMYELFIKNITTAVEQANSMISLTTIPGFTLAYLHKTRQEMSKELVDEINKISAFFVKNKEFKSTEENSKQLIDKYNLAQKFIQRNMKYAFVGTSPYAKSFMTSEYLYRYFKKNPMFDYTPIVSGYIKSVEQLLYVICRSYLKQTEKGDKNIGAWTMGDYENFINNNEDIIRPELRKMKDVIVACLKSYRVESRNRLFHRDYFNDWKKVEYIRQNTFFLYVVFLGMIEENEEVLSLLSEEYDRLFCIIDEDESRYYSFIIKGEEYCVFEKEPRNQGMIYNWNGLIRNRIRFKKLNYDHYERIELSSRNMPSKIWSTDAFGNKIKLLWTSG